MNKGLRLSTLISCLIVGLWSTSAPAQSIMAKSQPKAMERLAKNTLALKLDGASKGMHNITLRVVGPNGYSASEFSKRDIPALDLSKYGKLTDGNYTYEMTAASGNKVEVQSTLDNGRGLKGPKMVEESIVVSGSFTVRDGAIVTKDDTEE